MKAITKNLKISPKKLRVVAYCIRWKSVSDALDTLKFMQKKWALLLHKIISSALANAINNDNQESNSLKINMIEVSKWIVYKRWNPVSRGRYHPILKRTSNVKVELGLLF